MAGASKTPTPAKGSPAPKPADDRDALSVTDLARGVLSKDVRPRAADVRRLAEAVLAARSAKPKKTKDHADGAKKKAKGKKKLAKIPGQKSKK